MTTLPRFAVAAVLGSRLLAAEITGVVRDESTGEPVAGAVVMLEESGCTAVTGADGSYAIPEVPPGPHHLVVSLLGFQSRSLHVLVPASGSLRVDLVLRADPIEVDAVVVRSRVPIRGMDVDGRDLDPTRRVSGAAIRNDPFTAEPDVIEALIGGSISAAPESGGGLHVRGGDGDELGFLLDGIPVFSPYHSGVRSGAWNADAISGVELRTDPALPIDALSGAVLVSTIDPGDRLRTGGHLSTSQIGLIVNGPVAGQADFLLTGQAGYPGLIRPPDEPSYLDGSDHDLLAKLVVPIGGGDLRLLAFDNRNEVRASSRPSEVGDTPLEPGEPNVYAWRGRSVGLSWNGEDRELTPYIRAWRAAQEASFRWNGEESGRVRVTSDREQYGLRASLLWKGTGRVAEVGISTTRDEAAYAVAADSGDQGIGGDMDELAMFASYADSIGKRVELSASLRASRGEAGARLLPRVGIRARLAESVSVFAEYARTAQAVQSLRNAESVVGRIFPPELYAGGNGTDIPVAVADYVALGMVALPRAGTRLELEAYARALDDLAMLDPRDGQPFARAPLRRGSGSVQGVAAGLAIASARYAVTGSGGVERVELRAGGERWTPGYAASRSARIGAIVFPTPTLSIRIGWIGQFGRRGSDAIGLLEWESCNLLDMGCEFAGSPEELGELGARKLPAYNRLDLSIRKHWHFVLGRREGSVEAFATGSNLLGRANVLTFVVDPGSGESAPIEMRPRAPLTLGLGWRF
ncbi:MAG TPA: TonB-dependent receptor [Gemmatimonadota bacterium]|nr:TonB-dependent receptor [Gemmatimonadota bacterium]